MVNSVIVEDDLNYSKKLVDLLKKADPDVDVVAISTNLGDAITAVNDHQPQLVFLDIKLGADSGFDLLKQVKDIKFDVIFTTAHIDKNISEIRASALSYLPKPVILSELEDALKKFYNKQDKAIGNYMLRTFKANLLTSKSEDNVIWLCDNAGNYTPVEIKDILYCTSENQYTIFHIQTTDREPLKMISSKGIGYWETDLSHYRFCRIHNRYLINLKHVVKYMKNEGAVKMSDGVIWGVANERKTRFLKLSGIK